MSERWIRFEHAGSAGWGRLDGDRVEVRSGSLYGSSRPTGDVLPLAEVELLMPVQPSKVLALWNNFGALRAKLGLALPEEPLYLIKSPNGYLAPNGTIRKPPGDGKLVFEGELGIVIGKACSAVGQAQAIEHVFGYTCGNDATLADELHRDPSFPQWVRAKGHDTFCPLGPAVASGLDPATLRVQTLVDGVVRQDYPVSDMTFPVARLVSLLSHDMTLLPGDVILCGTSVGAGSMKPGSRVDVRIDGIGTLSNRVA